MRKLPAIILSLTFLLALVGCGKAANNAELKSSKSLYAKGLEIVQVMSEMTQNEEYVDIYTGSSEIKTIIQNIGIGDYSSPKAVYSISVTDENWAAMEELNGLDSASKELKTFLTQRVFGSLMTQINGRSGVENLAAASVCTVSNTFVDKNGKDVKDVITKAAETNDSIKALYDFQHNYADKIFEKYGGSMIAAIMCYQSDMQLGNQNIKLSDEYYSSETYFNLIMNLNTFAAEYDIAFEKYGNVGNNNVTQEIYDKIVSQTGWQSNDNILYQYLADGTISPVVGTSYITTDAFYGPGLEYLGIKEGDMHSTAANGTAADLGTHSQNLPVVSVFNSSFLIGNSYGYTNGGGYYISLYSNGLKTDFKHLLGSSSAYANLYSLNTSGNNAGIWSFPVPSNYQIGNVGNSGALTTNTHLHFQNTKWR